MKIYIERKWKKDGYTIGDMWVDGKWFCNTLEPVDRGLVNDSLPGKTGSVGWRMADRLVRVIKGRWPAGSTAIPEGAYRAVRYMSKKFRGYRILLEDVPGFSGILIHEGNKAKHTQGCILVGRNTAVGQVLESGETLRRLNERVFSAMSKGETVVVKVVGG